MKTFPEKLLELRRRAGLSQEQLADRLGVTRQSVSKWEGGSASPELGKLVALSELFSVSVDYLVKDRLDEPEPAVQAPKETPSRCWAWDSQTKLMGIPLISVRFFLGRFMHVQDVARGIIAIGNVSVGVFSLGLTSVGLISIGSLSAGLLAAGAVAFGLAALGPVAIGLLAFGPAAVGLWYAGGVAALGGKIAVGLAALGETAVGYSAAGRHVLLWGSGLTRAEVRAFLLEHHPELWKPILELLAALGANIK